ncbi:MAG: flagellar biosynthesis protein FlgL, partial [Epsilonproteobacteria bacterium]|nr:flagellar biosynthesis protein FlgL [Campylobacterota bacterium]
MRVTSNMYYKNLYGTNNSKLSEKLFDVNKQIASGLKIQYAQDDVGVFSQTMRLDNELSSLSLVKKSTQSGYKISNQADIVLNEFDTTMDRMRTLLVNASNDSHSDVSRDAIADELEVLEEHLKNLSNTSINGQYLFSGTAIDTRPISSDGTYQGNDGVLNSVLGSNIQQQYNISGSELFLGEEVLTKREITTNVKQINLTNKYDYTTKEKLQTNDKTITSNDTIRDLMGDVDSEVDGVNNKHHFYIRGVKSDGTAFKEKIDMKDDD